MKIPKKAKTPPYVRPCPCEVGVPQKNLVPNTCLSKKIRWTARGRIWSNPPCSVRSSSILLVGPLSKCQHPGQTNSVQEGPKAGLTWWNSPALFLLVNLPMTYNIP